MFCLIWGFLLLFSVFSGLLWGDVCYCSAPEQLLNCFKREIGGVFGLLTVFGGVFVCGWGIACPVLVDCCSASLRCFMRGTVEKVFFPPYFSYIHFVFAKEL